MEVKNYEEVPDDLDMEHDGSNDQHAPSERREPVEHHPLPNYQPPWVKKKRGTGKKVLATLLVLAVLAGLGAGAYLLGRKSTPASQQTTHKSQAQSAPAPASNLPAGTALYKSPKGSMNLSFLYPKAWTVKPPSGQAGETVTVTSPLLSLPSASGEQVTGEIVVRIRGGGATMNELANTTATIAQDSTQYAYNAPTSAQHHYFYVTFLHFQGASSSVKGAFEEAVITGIDKFNAGSTAMNGTFSDVDPLVTASFYQCATQACTGSSQTMLSVTGSDWQSDTTLQQVISLFESFKFN